MPRPDIDPLDRKILKELQDDASQSLDDIARKVGSSKTPVWNRIRKMREMGIIGRQTVILDPEGKVAHHWAKVSAKGHAEKVREKLQELRKG